MEFKPVGNEQPTITIDGEKYVVNLAELQSFLVNCKGFMETDAESLQIMTDAIIDQVIDTADDNMQVTQLVARLKFLREVGFLFRGLLSTSES